MISEYGTPKALASLVTTGFVSLEWQSAGRIPCCDVATGTALVGIGAALVGIGEALVGSGTKGEWQEKHEEGESGSIGGIVAVAICADAGWDGPLIAAILRKMATIAKVRAAFLAAMRARSLLC